VCLTDLVRRSPTPTLTRGLRAWKEGPAAIPAAPGTYLLVLRCSAARGVRVGRLGTLRLRPGWYVYAGSAFGPGGLRARIQHHMRRAARPHWHIDTLRRFARVESVRYVCDARCEHEWAAAIGAMPGGEVAMPGFGSSDCRCPTHLWYFEQEPGLALLPQSGPGGHRPALQLPTDSLVSR